ncbi:MAG: Na+/H+ antiporter [Janthinobacterium lividum]
MDIVSTVLLLLACVVASTICARLLPSRFPLPLLQIALGAALSWCGVKVAFDSQLFLLLFIPPLLFLDGWRMPKGAFFRDWKVILSLAIGLVVFTVVGVGFFVHWLIPAMPLAVAFALAAILSPTDPVALGAMTASAPLPARLLHILEGEALFNDATGLVGFSFAVAAALSGHFSIIEASWSFLLVAGGGLVTGLLVTWLIARINQLLIRHAGEEPAIQMLVSLLIPFASYMVAEHLQVSGILAAATAGFAMHYVELSVRPQADTRMLRSAVWDTVQISLNGIIFILLGLQLPVLLAHLPEISRAGGARTAWHLLGYIVSITLVLALLRALWVWISMRLTLLSASAAGHRQPEPHARLLAVISISGVRGAITLAGILTLPSLMHDGSAFPTRELAIILAMGVILFSLITAGIVLPVLARGLVDLPQLPLGASEGRARHAAAQAAIDRVEALAAGPLSGDEAPGLRNQAAHNVLENYRRHLIDGDAEGEHHEAAPAKRQLQMERDLRVEGLRAARDKLFALRRTHDIDDDVHRKLVREIDLLEAGLSK